MAADNNLGASTGGLVLNGGALLATSGFTLNSSRGIALGPISGNGTGTISVAATQTLTFNGAISDNPSGSGDSLVVGTSGNTGTLQLGGASTYSGATTVSFGKLTLASGASLGNTAISVASTAVGLSVLAGSGTFSAGTTSTGTAGATLSLASGSTFSMADSAVGTFNLQQQSSFGASNTALTISGANLNFDISASGADRLNVGVGKAVVSGTNTIGLNVVGSGLTPGAGYPVIAAAAGGLTGTFQFSGGSQTTSVTSGGRTYQLALQNTPTAQIVKVLPVPVSSSGLPVTTGLYAWYNAGFGVTTSGVNVQSWADESGNGHTMLANSGTVTLNPTGFNTAYPAVQLISNINSDSLISTNFTTGLGNNVTVFAVFTDTSGAGTESHAFMYGINSSSGGAMMLGKSNSNGGVAAMITGFGNNQYSTYNVSSGFSNIIESYRYTSGTALNSSPTGNPPNTSLKVNGTEYLPGSGSTGITLQRPGKRQFGLDQRPT